MWVAELHCARGHVFEGWFASREDYEGQQQRRLVSCPHCGDAQVERRLSAPRINLGAGRPVEPSAKDMDAPVATSTAASPVNLRELIVALRAASEDLGQNFADEARRIHRGDAPDRAIRGKADAAELESLLDEGITVFPLPDPEWISPTH